MDNPAVYCCLGVLFVVLVVVFAVSVRTNKKARRFCQPLYMFGGNPTYSSGEYIPCQEVLLAGGTDKEYKSCLKDLK